MVMSSIRCHKKEKGFTALETIIAVALIGIISAAFMNSLTTVCESFVTVDSETTARNLAESQMEFVKGQVYGDNYTPASVPTEYGGYTVEIVTSQLRIDIQRVTVSVDRGGEEITTLHSYKMNR
jgi:prepilin-type N-terminal cleavage/methylation domain-containing protein